MFPFSFFYDCNKYYSSRSGWLKNEIMETSTMKGDGLEAMNIEERKKYLSPAVRMLIAILR